MIVKIDDLTDENLLDAPEWQSHPFSCKYCIYWEYPEKCIDPKKEIKEVMLKMKLNWLKKTIKVFGNCGLMAYVNGKSVGYAQYAPAELLPRSKDYQSGPPSADAVLISCLFIPQKEFRRLGIGNKLLHKIFDDLRKRKVKAIETFARKGKQENPSGPMEFYLRNGFSIHKDDKEFPLMRLEL